MAGRNYYPVFAYGSNLNHREVASRCPDAVPDVAARLPDYRLAFRRVCDVEPAPGEVCHGALWWVTAEDLAALDRYEGHPTFYKRTVLHVETDADPQRRAFVYVLRDTQPGEFDEPWDHYLDIVRRGYFEWGLDLRELHRALLAPRKTAAQALIGAGVPFTHDKPNGSGYVRMPASGFRP